MDLYILLFLLTIGSCSGTWVGPVIVTILYFILSYAFARLLSFIIRKSLSLYIIIDFFFTALLFTLINEKGDNCVISIQEMIFINSFLFLSRLFGWYLIYKRQMKLKKQKLKK